MHVKEEGPICVPCLFFLGNQLCLPLNKSRLQLCRHWSFKPYLWDQLGNGVDFCHAMCLHFVEVQSPSNRLGRHREAWILEWMLKNTR